MVLSGYFLLDWGVKKALTKHVENFGSFLVRFCVDSTYISYGSRGATPSCDIHMTYGWKAHNLTVRVLPIICRLDISVTREEENSTRNQYFGNFC